MKHLFILNPKVYLLLSLIMSMAIPDLHASVLQDKKEITGTVIDTDGFPLIGASVVENETTNGTVTDLDGRFSLSVSDGATLRISYIGYLAQKVKVEGQQAISVTLKEDTQGLDEVVVVGYATQKKVNLTGSVETVKGDELARQPVAQASQALAGLVPGLTAIQSSGQPGKDNAQLRIRGIGSIGASNNPLVLIDGIEGDINAIDAADIANISVLKDAASAAIYGSRASNGVILITTKRAKEGKMTVNYRNYAGWQRIAEQPDFLGALDYLKYTGSTQAEIDEYAKGIKTNPDVYADTDWVNEVFSESGFQQYHNLSVNGGTEKMGVLASLSFIDQKGNIKNFGFTRYNGRVNTNMKFTDKFDLNLDLNFLKSENYEPTGGNLSSNLSGLQLITKAAYRIPPIYHVLHSDGSWGDGWNGGNPLAYATASGRDTQHRNYFRGILKANYRPFEGMNLSVMYAPEHNDSYRKRFEKQFQTVLSWDEVNNRPQSFRNVPERNSLYQANGRSFTDNFNAVVSYSKRIEDHDFTALGGYEFIKTKSESFNASRTDFELQDYPVLNAGSEANDANAGSATHSSLVSYFLRTTYSYKDRYLFEANVRRDASSRFAKENRVGIFPSFSAAWRLSEEAFLKERNIFSNLKLRASWGQLGNQQIGRDFPYASSIRLGAHNYVFGGEVLTGASQNVLANPDIMWETTETTNIGVDAGILKQRLTFSFDYYIRKTKDLLLNIPIPLVIGLNPSTQNAGNVENKGWDFTVSWQDNVNDFKYGVGLNASDVKNEVTNLAGIGPIINHNTITEVGSPIGQIYGYETAGIFQDQASIDAAPAQFGTLVPGNLQYKDQLTVDTDGDGIPDQGDGVINPDDRVVIGNPFPRLTFGMDLNAEYKGFDVSVSMQGVGKRDVLIANDLTIPLSNAGKIQHWQVKEFWSPDNTNAKYPILAPTSTGSNDGQPSSTWVFDASYLRVRNITVGYTLPKHILEKVAFQNLRIYLSGQNLFTFDKLPKGTDPLTPNNSNGSIYPVTKNFIMGIDLTF